MHSPHLFCFGLGYSAITLAERLLAKGWEVSGTNRSEEKCEMLAHKGMCSYVFPLPAILPPGKSIPKHDLHLSDSLELATHLLLSIPPDEKDGDIILKYFLSYLKHAEDIQWIGYLSTTGVYGDHQGGWVDETTPVNPPNARSQRRAEAEEAWLASGLPVHIFRLSGIYGKGRSAIDDLKNGTARRIDKKDQVFSRIHVDDIATILEASIKHPAPGSIYNCADDLPAPQEEVVAYAAKLLNMEPPPLIPFEAADLSPMARSFYESNRRVSNKKIKEELGVKLAYPDYKLGLLSCVE
jgi:nucleoside-diphosphate-sugar epimerase